LRVSFIGVDYVGPVSGVCFAELGIVRMLVASLESAKLKKAGQR
jgi:UDP-glucose 6-dehydrogenase